VNCACLRTYDDNYQSHSHTSLCGILIYSVALFHLLIDIVWQIIAEQYDSATQAHTYSPWVLNETIVHQILYLECNDKTTHLVTVR
jgi:hypothetical protein